MVIYAGLPAVALSALPVTADATAATPRELATTYAGDPILGHRREHGPRGLPDGDGVLRRRPRRDDPADRVQRRASSASAGSPTRWASTSSCPTGCAGSARASARRRSAIAVFGADRLHRDDPGPGGVPRHALRVRGDAVVHDRARLADRRCAGAWRAAGCASCPATSRSSSEEAWYRAPFNVRVRGVDVPVFAVLGGLGTFAAWIAVMGALHRRP